MTSTSRTTIDFSLPGPLLNYLENLDSFIAAQITPLQARDDNIRFFDHRREHSRTDWDNQGLPTPEWEALLRKAVILANKAGFWRFTLPIEYGGQSGSNLWMAAIRMHLARKGLGLFNDLQNEHSIVGNFPDILMIREFGSEEQKAQLIHARLEGKLRFAFGLTEPDHGSDATFMETRSTPTQRGAEQGFLINGRKKWQTGMHTATHVILFVRTSGTDGDANGITAFIIPSTAPGVTIESYEWTFNMPTDHATVSFTSVFAPASAVLGTLNHGLSIAQVFVHENRVRQAASSLGAAQYCLEESIRYSRVRKPFGVALAMNQGITFPIAELATQAEMLELLILRTAAQMDGLGSAREVEYLLGDKVSMCNFWANRLCTQAADQAMQVHGGVGYSRHVAFEHIYRHHRRYRITEGSEEIQKRKIVGYLFGYIGPRKEQFSKL